MAKKNLSASELKAQMDALKKEYNKAKKLEAIEKKKAEQEAEIRMLYELYTWAKNTPMTAVNGVKKTVFEVFQGK